MNRRGRRRSINVKDEIDIPGYLLSEITDLQQDHPERDDRTELLQPIAHQLPVILRIEVRTFLTFRESVNAQTSSSAGRRWMSPRRRSRALWIHPVLRCAREPRRRSISSRPSLRERSPNERR